MTTQTKKQQTEWRVHTLDLLPEVRVFDSAKKAEMYKEKISLKEKDIYEGCRDYKNYYFVLKNKKTGTHLTNERGFLMSIYNAHTFNTAEKAESWAMHLYPKGKHNLIAHKIYKKEV